MRITVERPEEGEVHELARKFGKPVVREFRFDMRQRDEVQDYPRCKGGTRTAVCWTDGVIMVRKREDDRFGLPGGRVLAEESVEDGAKREVREEVGLTIELIGMPELHKCQYLFRNWNLERWMFIFVGRAIGGSLEARDDEEIGEIAVFREPPSYFDSSHWLHQVWNKCLGR